jgi:acetyl esterase
MAKPLTLIESASARAISALSPKTQRWLAGRVSVELDGQVLDPGIQLLLRAMALRGGDTFIAGGGAPPPVERARVRKEALSIARWPTPVGSISELDIAGAAGPIRARHYAPAGVTAGAPLLVFFHGGGYVVGDLDTHDEPCRVLCRFAGVHVLSIEYRLAPENPFPAGLEDAIAATKWAQANAGRFAADPGRIAVAGDSAGGNFAAVTARELARQGEAVPALQVLIYPGTDFVATTHSTELFGEGFFLTRESMDWCVGHYLPPDADRADPRLSPLRAPDLQGLPPAIVLTAAFDPLRDEGEAYAEALRAAGNRVVLVRAPGLIHGFINLTVVNRSARDQLVALAGMIRAALALA